MGLRSQIKMGSSVVTSTDRISTLPLLDMAFYESEWCERASLTLMTSDFVQLIAQLWFHGAAYDCSPLKCHEYASLLNVCDALDDELSSFCKVFRKIPDDRISQDRD